MAVEQQPPVVLSLMLADNGHLDRSTHKYFILGTISAVRAKVFPCVVEHLCVYAALTDGRGKTPVVIKLIDADEIRQPIFAIESEVEFQTPLVVVERMLVLGGVAFPEPGEYRLQLYAAGQLLCERRLMVVMIPGSPANS